MTIHSVWRRRGAGSTLEMQAFSSDDDEVSEDDPGLSRRLLRTFRAPGYRPPVVPSVALEILRLSHDPDVAPRGVVSLLETDPVLAGRVLRLASSPLYCAASGDAVQSLHGAAVRLGMNALGDLVMEEALNLRVFSSRRHARAMAAIARHSSATAHMARVVGRYTPFPSRQAFLCGLLHDVGAAGAVLALQERLDADDDLADAWPAIGAEHERLSEIMVRLWGLSPTIQHVVGGHHRIVAGDETHPMAAIVCLAEHLATTHGCPLAPRGPAGRELELDVTSAESLDAACHLLGLGRDKRAELGRIAPDVVAVAAAVRDGSD
jgi:HD-like signal output (HDOD) protein